MNTKDKNIHILKKCASTNEFGGNILNNLTLRETKSYVGTMVDSKFYEFLTNQRYQDNQDNCLELFCKEYDMPNKNMIATKDVLTQDIFYVNEDLLNHKGKTYTANDVAWLWKKDCRMWLWKNGKDFKKNRSVGELKTI